MDLSGIGLGLIDDLVDESAWVVMVLLLLQFFAALHLLGYRLVLRVPREQQAGFFTFYAVQVAGLLAATLFVFSMLLLDGFFDIEFGLMAILGLGVIYLASIHFTSRRMMNLSAWQSVKAMPLIFLVTLSIQLIMFMDL